MKIQMDLPEALNWKIKIYKQLKNHTNISEAIIEILECKLKEPQLQSELAKLMSK